MNRINLSKTQLELFLKLMKNQKIIFKVDNSVNSRYRLYVAVIVITVTFRRASVADFVYVRRRGQPNRRNSGRKRYKEACKQADAYV